MAKQIPVLLLNGTYISVTYCTWLRRKVVVSTFLVCHDPKKCHWPYFKGMFFLPSEAIFNALIVQFKVKNHQVRVCSNEFEATTMKLEWIAFMAQHLFVETNPSF